MMISLFLFNEQVFSLTFACIDASVIEKDVFCNDRWSKCTLAWIPVTVWLLSQRASWLGSHHLLQWMVCVAASFAICCVPYWTVRRVLAAG